MGGENAERTTISWCDVMRAGGVTIGGGKNHNRQVTQVVFFPVDLRGLSEGQEGYGRIQGAERSGG